MRCQDAESQAANHDAAFIKITRAADYGSVPLQDSACADQFPDEDLPVTYGSQRQNLDQSSRTLCESMKVILLALLDRIDALESEMDEDQADALDLRDEVNQFEVALIRAALASTKGRQRRAARVLGVKVSTLNAKIRRHHVTDDFAGPNA